VNKRQSDLTPEAIERSKAISRAYYIKNKKRITAQVEKYRKANPDKVRKWQTKHYEQNKTAIAAKAVLWKKKNVEKHRESSRRGGWRLAGMPEPTRPCPELCECCGRKSYRCLHNDHDHYQPDKFRGWLCSNCNLGLGLLGDTKAAIQLAAAYLERTGST
jgi:hypothetical protein